MSLTLVMPASLVASLRLMTDYYCNFQRSTITSAERGITAHEAERHH